MQICGTVHGYMYAEKYFGISKKENQQANANLIAAAPDLYEALEALYTEQIGAPLLSREKQYSEAIEKARAALRKAEGAENI